MPYKDSDKRRDYAREYARKRRKAETPEQKRRLRAYKRQYRQNGPIKKRAQPSAKEKPYQVAVVHTPTPLPRVRAPKPPAPSSRSPVLSWSDELNCLLIDGKQPTAPLEEVYIPYQDFGK